MHYNNLGKSGLKVSALSFGSWVTFGNQIGQSTAEKCMKLAYDQGVNFFDNAEVYAAGKSEVVMGKILKKMKWDRSTYIVSSKVYWGGKIPNQRGLSFKHVTEACHAALKRLQVEYLDLYFCHRPDYNTPVEETVWAMNTLIRQGKILYWGTSEWPADRIMQAHLVARQNNLIPPVMEQPQYNMFARRKVEVEFKDLYEIGLGTTIWSPLASGLLTGKHNDGIKKGTRFDLKDLEWLKKNVFVDGRIAKIKKLGKLADKLNMSMTHLALCWCMKNPNVSTVILGASKISQLKDNLKALDHLDKLDTKSMEKIDTILGNKPERAEFL